MMFSIEPAWYPMTNELMRNSPREKTARIAKNTALESAELYQKKQKSCIVYPSASTFY